MLKYIKNFKCTNANAQRALACGGCKSHKMPFYPLNTKILALSRCVLLTFFLETCYSNILNLEITVVKFVKSKTFFLFTISLVIISFLSALSLSSSDSLFFLLPLLYFSILTFCLTPFFHLNDWISGLCLGLQYVVFGLVTLGWVGLCLDWWWCKWVVLRSVVVG